MQCRLPARQYDVVYLQKQYDIISQASRKYIAAKSFLEIGGFIMLFELELLFIVILMAASWILTHWCNNVFTEKYGKSVISLSWAGICALADVIAVTTASGYGVGDFFEAVIAVILTYISMKKCRERAAQMGADEDMCKKAMWIQCIAPLGLIGLYIALMPGSSSNKKKK